LNKKIETAAMMPASGLEAQNEVKKILKKRFFFAYY